jgi:tetratricopeptide (TPR) repeat protein
LQDALSFSQQTVAKFIAAQGGEAGMGAVAPLIDKKEQQDAGVDLAFADPTAPKNSADLTQAGLSNEEKQEAAQEEQYLRQILGSSFNDLGTSEAREGQFTSALKHFQQAERWNPEIPGLTRNLGVAAFRVQNYGECARALRNVVGSNGSDQPARIMLGISQYMISSYSDAAKTIAPLGEAAKDDPAVALPWAVSLAKTGDYKESAEILSGIERQQLSADTLFLVGQTWMEIESYDHAVATLHRALELSPGLPKAHFAAGLADIRGGHPNEAEAEFKAELALNPQDIDAEYNLAYAYLLESQRDKAVPLLQHVIASDPHHADANYQLGKLMMEDGKAEAAIPYLEAAERSGPEKDYVHYQLQAAYRQESRLADADRELQLYKDIKARNRERSTPRPEQNQ